MKPLTDCLWPGLESRNAKLEEVHGLSIVDISSQEPCFIIHITHNSREKMPELADDLIARGEERKICQR